MSLFVINDEMHAEECGEFASYEAALEELKTRAALPWNVEPNLLPCTGWKNCGRKYEIVEYDETQGPPWDELSKIPVLTLSSQGIVWDINFQLQE